MPAQGTPPQGLLCPGRMGCWPAWSSSVPGPPRSFLCPWNVSAAQGRTVLPMTCVRITAAGWASPGGAGVEGTWEPSDVSVMLPPTCRPSLLGVRHGWAPLALFSLVPLPGHIGVFGYLRVPPGSAGTHTTEVTGCRALAPHPPSSSSGCGFGFLLWPISHPLFLPDYLSCGRRAPASDSGQCRRDCQLPPWLGEVGCP